MCYNSSSCDSVTTCRVITFGSETLDEIFNEYRKMFIVLICLRFIICLSFIVRSYDDMTHMLA